MKKTNLNKIAQALRKFDIPPQYSPNEARLMLRTLNVLIDGSPVSVKQIEQISTDCQMPVDAATSLLFRFAERDDDGNIVGLLGLSQKDHPHRFTVNGRAFHTWCAWDSLFLPTLLKMDASVESFCPVTKSHIQLSVTPDRVALIKPDDAVMSMVAPDKKIRVQGVVEEIWNNFCCRVHFFSSTQAAGEWIADKGKNLVMLSIEEGYDLGNLAFEDLQTSIRE